MSSRIANMEAKIVEWFRNTPYQTARGVYQVVQSEMRRRAQPPVKKAPPRRKAAPKKEAPKTTEAPAKAQKPDKRQQGLFPEKEQPQA